MDSDIAGQADRNAGQASGWIAQNRRERCDARSGSTGESHGARTDAEHWHGRGLEEGPRTTQTCGHEECATCRTERKNGSGGEISVDEPVESATVQGVARGRAGRGSRRCIGTDLIGTGVDHDRTGKGINSAKGDRSRTVDGNVRGGATIVGDDAANRQRLVRVGVKVIDDQLSASTGNQRAAGEGLIVTADRSGHQDASGGDGIASC